MIFCFTFPLLFRLLSVVSPFALCTPFFGAECVIFATSFCILAIFPFCFQFVHNSCLTHELDLSALDECLVGKVELPNYLCDQDPVIEFLTYGNNLRNDYFWDKIHDAKHVHRLQMKDLHWFDRIN